MPIHKIQLKNTNALDTWKRAQSLPLVFSVEPVLGVVSLAESLSKRMKSIMKRRKCGENRIMAVTSKANTPLAASHNTIHEDCCLHLVLIVSFCFCF